MLKRRREKNISEKKKIIVLCLFFAIIIGLTVWANIYFRQGEWNETNGSSGSFGADSYYDGGYGTQQVDSQGIRIKYTANVHNDGTMVLAIRKIDNDIIDKDNYYSVYDLEIIDSIEISGNGTGEIYINSDEYSEVIIHEYTPDNAEASTHYEIYSYTSNVTKFGKWLNRVTFGKFDKQIDSIFDIH